MSDECIIRGCRARGTVAVQIDVGPTIGDALVAESARVHDAKVCDIHAALVRVPVAGLSLVTEEAEK